MHLGKSSTADAIRQRHEPVLPRLRVGPTLQTRRRRTQRHHRPLFARADDGHFTRVVPRGFVLLVAALVLLVHDDRTDVGDRRKHRGPRAHDDALVSPTQCGPRVEALAVAQRAVQHRHLIAEHRAKAVHGLRRERDLRNQHDGAHAALSDHVLEPLEVDQRLAAPRHAVEQHHLAWLRVTQRADGGDLSGRRLMTRVRRAHPRRKRIALDHVTTNGEQSTVAQRLEHRRRE